MKIGRYDISRQKKRYLNNIKANSRFIFQASHQSNRSLFEETARSRISCGHRWLVSLLRVVSPSLQTCSTLIMLFNTRSPRNGKYRRGKYFSPFVWTHPSSPRGARSCRFSTNEGNTCAFGYAAGHFYSQK